MGLLLSGSTAHYILVSASSSQDNVADASPIVQEYLLGALNASQAALTSDGVIIKGIVLQAETSYNTGASSDALITQIHNLIGAPSYSGCWNSF